MNTSITALYCCIDDFAGSVTSCLEICPRNAFLAPPGPHRSEGVAGTEMRA